MSHYFDPEKNELTTDTRLNPNGLSIEELVLGGCGMFRASILEMLDVLIQAGIEEMPLVDLREIIAEAELELDEVPIERS